MRYSAPSDVSEVFLSSGPVPVIDGFIEVPEDASTANLAGLFANGFRPDGAAPKAAIVTKTDSKADAKAEE